MPPFIVVVNCSLDKSISKRKKRKKKNVPRARDVLRLEPCPCPPNYPPPPNPHRCHHCGGGDGYLLCITNVQAFKLCSKPLAGECSVWESSPSEIRVY